jgi:hypothetical protein
MVEELREEFKKIAPGKQDLLMVAFEYVNDQWKTQAELAESTGTSKAYINQRIKKGLYDCVVWHGRKLYKLKDEGK